MCILVILRVRTMDSVLNTMAAPTTTATKELTMVDSIGALRHEFAIGQVSVHEVWSLAFLKDARVRDENRLFFETR